MNSGNQQHGEQSIGGQGATDALSGSEHSGTEGADSGQGVNKGKHKHPAGKGHGHGGQHSSGMGGEHGDTLHDVGSAQSGMTGRGGMGGNDSERNKPDKGGQDH